MSLEEIHIETLQGYLKWLRKRPLMVLPKKEIGYLDANIQGYIMAKYNESIWFQEFGDFVSKQFDVAPSSLGWRNLILEKCNNDQDNAFNLFFNLFDKYVEYKNKPTTANTP